jgi:hypothetical protein
MDDSTGTGSVGVFDAIENTAENALHAVEDAGAAVVAEVETIVSKVEKFFGSTNNAHLQDALVAMATTIDEQGKKIAELGRFTLGK